MRFLTSSLCAVALTAGLYVPAFAQSQDAQPGLATGVQSSFEVASNGSTGTESGNFEVSGTSALAAPALRPPINLNGAAPTLGADFSMWNTSMPSQPLMAVAKPVQAAQTVAEHPADKMLPHIAALPPAEQKATATAAVSAPPALNRLATGLFERTRDLASRVTASAMHFIGTPYVFGGTSTYGFDCSGYVQHVFAMFGIALPRTADAQYLVGQHVAQRQMVRGDLVFFQTYTAGVSHVGIYLGNGSFIHSSSRGVQISKLEESYWASRYVGATHILGTHVGEADVASSHSVN